MIMCAPLATAGRERAVGGDGLSTISAAPLQPPPIDERWWPAIEEQARSKGLTPAAVGTDSHQPRPCSMARNRIRGRPPHRTVQGQSAEAAVRKIVAEVSVPSVQNKKVQAQPGTSVPI
jgi:hypothetical protein